jgi:hypothetical protein
MRPILHEGVLILAKEDVGMFKKYRNKHIPLVFGLVFCDVSISRPPTYIYFF